MLLGDCNQNALDLIHIATVGNADLDPNPEFLLGPAALVDDSRVSHDAVRNTDFYVVPGQ